MRLIEAGKPTDGTRHRVIAAVLRVARFSRRRCLQHTQGDVPDTADAELAGRRTRQIELPVAPVGTSIVNPNDDGFLGVLRPHERDGPVRQNRARSIVGPLRREPFARGRQTARIEAIFAAAVVVGGDDPQVAADEGLRLGDRFHPMALFVEAIGLSGPLGLGCGEGAKSEEGGCHVR